MLKNKQKLFKYLASQRLMSLATSLQAPWICNVYYVIDNSFNLYFLSEPKSKHCQDIAQNQEVACSVADSSQKVTDKKVGAQIQGTVRQVRDWGEIERILSMWNKANPGFEKVINIDNIKNKVINSKVYKIKPKLIKWLNEELYGLEGFEVFEF